VKRAAAKARDAGELYLLIAEEIQDKDERNAFVRKAISASESNEAEGPAVLLGGSISDT